MTNWDFYENIPDFHPIADANNIFAGFKKTRQSSAWKTSVQRFRWNKVREVRKLQIGLDNMQHERKGAYELSPYSCFNVNERGKTRAITALGVSDRTVKNVLNVEYLLPHIRPHLIYDNGASLEGRGVSLTRRRLQAHLEGFYRETRSNEGYILTVDFSGYYDNIDHSEAMRIVEKYEDDEFARMLVKQAINSYKIDVSYMSDKEFEEAKTSKFSTVEYRNQRHTDNELRGEKFLHKSLSVGDPTSQVIAITFPTEIDNLVKVVYSIKWYGRYMDDFYIIAKTKEELQFILSKIMNVADKLKIIINPKKTKIQKLSQTFTFLQFKYYLSETGHVVTRINPKTVTRMRHRLKKLHKLLLKCKVSLSKIE